MNIKLRGNCNIASLTPIFIGPGSGGMSVTPGGGTVPHMGGNNLGVFCIPCKDLGPNLRFVRDPANPVNHGFVEPVTIMSHELYQESLWATRSLWRPFSPPPR